MPPPRKLVREPVIRAASRQAQVLFMRRDCSCLSRAVGPGPGGGARAGWWGPSRVVGPEPGRGLDRAVGQAKLPGKDRKVLVDSSGCASMHTSGERPSVSVAAGLV